VRHAESRCAVARPYALDFCQGSDAADCETEAGAQCLQFFENRRPVMTLSYERVFMPLYECGIGT